MFGSLYCAYTEKKNLKIKNFLKLFYVFLFKEIERT